MSVAGGLALPAWQEEAKVRQGTNDGAPGGRHGKNRRGRNDYASTTVTISLSFV
jgi:hypothetical protein